MDKIYIMGALLWLIGFIIWIIALAFKLEFLSMIGLGAESIGLGIALGNTLTRHLYNTWEKKNG